MSINPHAMKPYRVEWRGNLTERWVLMTEEAVHGTALEIADRKAEEFGGQVRVVSQHVIAVRGQGGENFPNDA